MLHCRIEVMSESAEIDHALGYRARDKGIRMKLFLVAATVLLASCDITPTQPIEPIVNPICDTPERCEIAWATARNWVLSHSETKLQIYTADYMENYTPSNTADFTISVSKTPLGNGRYEIAAHFGCRNMFGCSPGAYAVTMDFNHAVTAAIPKE